MVQGKQRRLQGTGFMRGISTIHGGLGAAMSTCDFRGRFWSPQVDARLNCGQVHESNFLRVATQEKSRENRESQMQTVRPMHKEPSDTPSDAVQCTEG